MEIFFRYLIARLAGRMRPQRISPAALDAGPALQNGLSVVIPSRDGKELLRAQLPAIIQDLTALPAEVIVVDNGSSDGTAARLNVEHPEVLVEVSPEPLSFAKAVNRGIARARFSHVCLLNNDMLIEPGFFAALGTAFDKVPDLFCATAQIRFPAGLRREETGKAVMAQDHPDDFPLRCDVPVPGEDLTWVLYGSGGCSVYDTGKLRSLGSFDDAYEPAYVEDLDISYRAWQRGWPSVYVDGAIVEHRHRATTSRYYTEAELQRILEINYLKFLARAVADPRLFRRLWRQAIIRLELLAAADPAALPVLRAAPSIATQGGPAGSSLFREADVLALTNGSSAVFPGRGASGRPRRIVLTPSLKWRKEPLDPGRDNVVVALTQTLESPPSSILDASVEVVVVSDPAALRLAIQLTARKWNPAEVRPESGSMKRYAAACAPARIIR